MIAYATASDDYNGNIRGKRDTVTCNSILILKKSFPERLGVGLRSRGRLEQYPLSVHLETEAKCPSSIPTLAR